MMQEHEYYNLHGGRGLSKEDVEQEIERRVANMMTIHLYREHNMGVREIAKQLGIKQKQVSSTIKEHFGVEK